MNNDDNLDERLTQSLERQAAQVPLRSHLTSSALKQASRIRARRRAGAVVASVAALAVAIPVGLQIFNDGRPNSLDPIGPSPSTSVTASVPSPSQSPQDPEPTRKQEWKFDFDELDRGPEPTIPYVDTDSGVPVVHEGGETRELDVNDRLAAVVGAGDVVWTSDQSDIDFVLIRPDGERVLLTEGISAPEAQRHFAGVSADGTRMAWSESMSGSNAGEGSTTLWYADAETGKVLHRGETHGGLDAIGFVGSRVLLSKYDESTMLWDAPADKYTSWKGIQVAYETEPSLGLVSLGRAGADGFPCGALVESDAPTVDLWRSCDRRIDTFSPTGEFGTATHPQTDGLGPTILQLVQARSNKVLVTLGGDEHLMANPAWESDRAVIVSVSVGGEWALVRCTVDGTCELASDPIKASPEDQPIYPVKDSRT